MIFPPPKRFHRAVAILTVVVLSTTLLAPRATNAQSPKPNLANSTDTTYLQCYGIKDSFTKGSFTPRSQLTKKVWGVNSSNQYVKLGGYWKNSSLTATTENYFVVQTVDTKAVTAAQVHDMLGSLCRDTIKRDSEDYSKNIAYFASDTSAGYEYPVLSETEAKEIVKGPNVFSYAKILRYAFAASYAYSIEEGAGPFPFFDNPSFKRLMLAKNSDKVDTVDTVTKAASGVHAVALRVPRVPGLSLEEEIIISFKGTSSLGDFGEDIKLTFVNFFEWNKSWQEDAYQFCKKVIERYPPNSNSLARGYQGSLAATSYNIVLTGHSLGGYTAIEVGTRTGIVTRTFSSPATRVIEKYAQVFANKMWLRNVINFIREGELLIKVPGPRSDENIIYYPAAGGIFTNNHSLKAFISGVLEKLYQNETDRELQPRYIYITPNATKGAGLKERINRWGDEPKPKPDL